MTNTVKSLVTLLKADEIEFSPLGLDAEVQEMALAVNPLSTTMGGGICRMKECNFDWQIKYDEVIFVQSGSMYIGHNGEKIEAKQGDIYFMKEGAVITYGTDEEVEFVFSTYPVNWKEVKQDVQYENNGESLVTLIKGSEIKFNPLGIEAEVQEIASVINPISTTLGGGVCRMKNGNFDWQIKYDEMIYVSKGSMYITHNGEKIEANQGDIYFMKDGAEITYGTDEEVEFYFTLYPVNWRLLK
ncbi:cupin domain-containing protein [Neobacillus sp. KR4-4]|uniref:cupin domain-containing protein n=1 Tax=Neobacillus sp. KR4-4 TaxID=3344872 RepID=UPI0035CBCC18